MAKQLQLRRGTTAQHSTFTGAVGEVTVDTDKDVVVVHDGSTAGGHSMTKAVSSTDNAVVRFDGTSGQVQNSSVVIDDSGNVGIGTSSPNRPFHLYGSGTRQYIKTETTGSTSGDEAGLEIKTGTADWLILSKGNSKDLLFYDSASTAERMRIDSSGNTLIWGSGSTSAHKKLRFMTEGSSGYVDARSCDIYATSSGKSGVDSADLVFETVSTGTKGERMRIDSSGNVGIGVTPSAWRSQNKALQVGDITSFYQDGVAGGAGGIMSVNSYISSTGSKYLVNAGASIYQQYQGTHTWYTAPSGTAGNVISWTTAMTLDASGNLTVGEASASGIKTISVSSGTLADDQTSNLYAQGGTSGVLNRSARLFVYKHSGISNACASLALNSQDGATNFFWTDDSDQFRISTSPSHIGTTSGTVVGTQTSDERVKNIVGTCPYGLNEILGLETYKYSMKDDVEGTYKLGFVAQQAMGVIPESVYDTNERLKEPVTVTKTKVVQEAKEEVTEQKLVSEAVEATYDDEGNELTPTVEAIYETVVVQEAQEEVTEKYEDIEYVETEDTITKLAMDYSQIIPALVNSIKELKAEIEILKGAK